jgi:predicted RNase H-like nuclease (RuvC/YqgF family)
MKLVESQFDKQNRGVSALTARNGVLTRQISEQKDKIELLRNALENSAESFGENDRRTQQWTVQLNNAEAELNNMERELKSNEKAIDGRRRISGRGKESGRIWRQGRRRRRPVRACQGTF